MKTPHITIAILGIFILCLLFPIFLLQRRHYRHTSKSNSTSTSCDNSNNNNNNSNYTYEYNNETLQFTSNIARSTIIDCNENNKVNGLFNKTINFVYIVSSNVDFFYDCINSGGSICKFLNVEEKKRSIFTNIGGE